MLSNEPKPTRPESNVLSTVVISGVREPSTYTAISPVSAQCVTADLVPVGIADRRLGADASGRPHWSSIRSRSALFTTKIPLCG